MTIQTATFGGGCFWCVEAALRTVRGVKSVVSGYAGGVVAAPTYADVCGGGTGHAEVVQAQFDDSILDYRRLLEMFFALHDPTTRDRQGNDIGPQYRSIIFCHGAAQHEVALRLIAELDAAKIWPGPIVTEICEEAIFYPAEDYHQDYFARNPTQGYCAVVIAPKLEKFQKLHADALKSAVAGERQ